MSPGAFWYHLRSDDRREQSGVAWALAAAILFVAIAAISFAVDQSVTLSSRPPRPRPTSTGRQAVQGIVIPAKRESRATGTALVLDRRFRGGGEKSDDSTGRPAIDRRSENRHSGGPHDLAGPDDQIDRRRSLGACDRRRRRNPVGLHRAPPVHP